MRKILLALVSLFALCANAEKVVTLDFSDGVNTWGLPDGSSKKVTTETTFTNGTYSVTVTAANGAYYLSSNKTFLMGKQDATLVLPAMDFNVGKIVLKGVAGGSGKVAQNIYVGDKAVSSEIVGIQSDIEFGIASDAQTAGTVYTLKVTNANNTQFTGIEFHEATGEVVKKEPNLKWSTSSKTILIGTEYTSPTFSYSTTAPITFTTSDPDVATVSSEGVVSLATDEGKAVITATCSENDEYKAGTATYTLTVCHNNYYIKVSSIESGAKYLIAAQRNDSTIYAQPLSSSKNYGFMSASTIKELKDEISVLSGYDDEFIFTASGSGYTIQDNTGRYYYQSGTFNSLNVGTDAMVWTVEPQNDGTFKISMNGYYLCWGKDTYTTFAAYQELGNAACPMLYKYNGTTPSAIENVTVAPAGENAAAFNVAGQRVNASAKGLIIKGGKKYINK